MNSQIEAPTHLFGSNPNQKADSQNKAGLPFCGPNELVEHTVFFRAGPIGFRRTQKNTQKKF